MTSSTFGPISRSPTSKEKSRTANHGITSSSRAATQAECRSRARGQKATAPCLCAGLVLLEPRTLLTGIGGADISTLAVPLPLDSPLAATIAPFTATYYRVSTEVGGKLTVALQAPGIAARVSLVDSQGRPLVQADAPAAGTGDRLIDVHVGSGDEFLEVQSLGGGGTYQITARLEPSTPPFEPVPSQFPGFSPLAAADFDRDAVPDLIAPDGVHLGIGDGTFEQAVAGGPLAEEGWSVTAIAVADFDQDGLPDVAFTAISPDWSTAELHVLHNIGGNQFQLVAQFAFDALPVAIQVIDFGQGIVNLAVADVNLADFVTGHVAIFVGDGEGGFSRGPVLDVAGQPFAMAAGRFGDGHVNLIVADQGDPFTGAGLGLTVFQADGPGQFHRSGTIDVGSGVSALVAADFGNGHLDLAVAQRIPGEVSVLLGNGDGTFRSPRSYSVGSRPVSLVAGDFGNGHIDLAAANENSGDVSVLQGNGDGTFQQQILFAAGSSPAALVSADFNVNHRPDLAVANLGSNDISVLLGRGDGTFQDTITNTVGNGPVNVITADLNHDGHVNAVTANSDSNDVSVLLGTGDGTFRAMKSFPAGARPFSVVACDVNGDGRVNLAVADHGDSQGNGSGVSVLLGNGDGSFQKQPFLYAAGRTPWSLVAGDFTGDSMLDLAVANHDSNDVSILQGNGLGGFTTLAPISLGDLANEPVSIAAADFTGDGVLDLAVANQGSNNISILLHNGLGGFGVLPPIPLGAESRDFPSALTIGDVTGDGLPDLAVAVAGGDGTDHVSILRGRGQGQFDLSPPIPLGFGRGPTSIVAAPFLGGPLDLVVVENYVSKVVLLHGDGQGGFEILSEVNPGKRGTATAVATGDLTGDGKPDLIIGRSAPNNLDIELNQGGSRFVEAGSIGLSAPNTPLVADLTGDGVPDVTIVNGTGDILFRRGQASQPGKFDPPITINTGFPSRGIAAVATGQGTLLASVDATDNAVSLFDYRGGQFVRVQSLATGLQPAQIVPSDLQGIGEDDLVIRNAGDGTLTIYPSDGQGGFRPRIDLQVGPGISDVSVADVNQDGLLDLLLANQVTGEVEVMFNLGISSFRSPSIYRAGVGLSSMIEGTGDPGFSLLSQEGTTGVVAGALTPGGPPDLVALNSGSETLGVLAGLGAGRFANPSSLPTGPTSALRMADLNGDGNADLALLGPAGLSTLLGDGRGIFSPAATYDVGPDPTGLTIADINNDGRPDLLVGNSFGDVLELLSEGDGSFRPPSITDASVYLDVTTLVGDRTPTFIYANQSRDRIVVQNGPGANSTVLGDRTSGLLVPGAPVTADLNGDRVPDLIVPNTGGNSVLVYAGLPGGGFGAALNNGNGLFTGTNPVAVVVADVNGDNRPDLIVANKGSNDVSILLNKSIGTDIEFEQGPRLHVGAGPVALAYGDFFGNGTPEIAVSDSSSKDVMLLPGRGNGFFDDVNPTVIPLNESPGPIFFGRFLGGTGVDLLALNPSSGSVTVISDVTTGKPVYQSFSSGGLNPVAAVTVHDPSGFDDLIVANNANGRVVLLIGGPEGLEESLPPIEFTSPTALASAFFHDNVIDFYAAREGEEAATLLEFALGAPSSAPTGTDLFGEGPVPPPGITLLPSMNSSLPLIATLLISPVDVNATEEEPKDVQEATAVTIAFAAAPGASVGQGLPPSTVGRDEGVDEGDVSSTTEEDSAQQDLGDASSVAPWSRFVLGLDEAFDELRRESKPDTPSGDDPEEGSGSLSPHPKSRRIRLTQSAKFAEPVPRRLLTPPLSRWRREPRSQWRTRPASPTVSTGRPKHDSK